MTDENEGGGGEMSKYQLKKLVAELEDIRGRNTELVSVYVPQGYDMSKISEFLTSEASEAENIKSKHTRKNVQAALDRISRRVKNEQETPENGVAFFAGNVSDTEGRPDIQLWEVVPPEPIQSRHYRCDKEFVLEPLKQMIVDDRVYGLIVVDKSEAAIGYLQGSNVKTAYTMESNVPGKTRAGGQCLAPDTTVQLSSGETKEIKDIEAGDSVKAADFDKMEMKDSRVTDKWENEKELYRIQTKHPKMVIEASADHEIFINNRSVESKEVRDVKTGDRMLIPKEHRVSDREPKLESKKLYNAYRISEKGRNRIKQGRKEKGLSQRELGDRTGRTQTAVSKIEKGERDIKRGFLEDLMEELDLQGSFVKSYCIGKDFRLPTEITPELAKIIGYFAGDGSFDTERINFHENDEEVAEHYRELLEETFECNTSIRFREEKNYYNLRAFGKPLVKLFENEFPEIKKSGNTRIPEKIMVSGEENIASFLKGFYDAEGHCSDSRGRVGISANNKTLMYQLQQQLMRFGIISSISRYDNSENPYSEKPRFTVSISDQKSLENFEENIGFTAERKQQELEKVTGKKKVRNSNRQILTNGKDIRDKIEKHGKLMSDFKSSNSFLQGKREISETAFRENLVEESSGELEKELEKEIERPEFYPTKINSIEKIGKSKTIDISVEAGNFVANGLVVHNSAQRFARLRESMLDTFLKDIAENAKNAFLDKAREDKLLGIIVGGPGFTKDKLLDEGYLHQELEDEVIDRESLNYSGEEALEELVEKAEDSIQDSQVVREKNLMNDFLENLKEENGKSEYGLEQVMKAMKMGAVDTVLISEDVNTYEVLYECPNGHEKRVYEEEARIDDSVDCDECGEEMELKELSDIVDVMGEKAEEMSSDVEIISTDHEEGQRLANLGGIAALLRYRIR
ncbi:MAG: LAGLIDADG family homing endonuclease [Candidatus Nanohaloarchaea archaeon]